jgi:ribose transport system permease protein
MTISLFTSVLIVNFKIPSIVSTIAVNGTYIALAMYLCNNYTINIRRPELGDILLKFNFLSIPFSVWLMFIFFGIAYVMLYHTRLGAHIYAVGANSVAARLNGVPVNNVIRATLIWSALCVSLAAIVQTTRGGITMLYGSTGGFAPFTALTPVMLGGISLFGGRGRIENMLVAIMFTTVLFNGLIMMNASTGLIQLCNGLVILLALIISATRNWFARLKG